MCRSGRGEDGTVERAAVVDPHVPGVEAALPPPGGWARALRLARHAPFTVLLVALIWVLGAATASLVHGPSPALAASIGAGLGPIRAGAWWGLATSALWCRGLASYVVSTLLVVALLPVAERRLGSVRAVGLAVLVQVGGSALGLAWVWLLDRYADGRWADQLAVSVAVGPGTAVVGVTLVASACLAALWRRRLRLVLVIALLMLALYSGLIGDLLRLSAGLLGLAVGALLFGRLRRHEVPVVTWPSRLERRVLVALVVAASALGPLVAAWAQSRVGPLSVLRYVFAAPPPDAATVRQICAGVLDPRDVRECAELQARLRFSGLGPALLSVMPVVLLLVAAEGLRRGRRAAWGLAVGLNLGLAALAVVLMTNHAQQRIVLGAGAHPRSWIAILLPLVQPLLVVVLLLVTRARFHVRAPRGTYPALLRGTAGALVLAAAAYVALGLGLRDDFDPAPDVVDLLRDLPLRFVPPGYLVGIAPGFLPVDWAAVMLYEWIGPAVWLVLAAAALRTFLHSRPDSADTNLTRVRALVGEGAGGSLQYMATWPGHAYWFTPDGAAAVAHRVIGGVAVTTGGPVGSLDAVPRAVAGFAEYCREQGWTPCFYSVDTEVATAARELGWSIVQVAEETLLPLRELTFTGRKWQDVRTALNRAAKAGIVAEWTTFSAAPVAIIDQIRAISEEWVADKGLPEMGFTLGGLDELADDEVRLLVAVDADSSVHGLTSWLPVRRHGEIVGWTLDFMRRRSDERAFRGVMEFLIASAATSLKEEGAEYLSLSGAPLARLDRGEPMASLQKVLDAIGQRLEPVYGFRSLLAFKAKFQPEYRPLYLAYPDAAALPAIGNAIGRAYLPDLRPTQAAALARALFAR
jgi:phosphatidylglycerol lysyltransferase